MARSRSAIRLSTGTFVLRHGAESPVALQPHRTPARASADQLRLMRNRDSDLAELAHPSDLDPLDHKDVAGVIEAGAVRTDELAGRELIA